MTSPDGSPGQEPPSGAEPAGEYPVYEYPELDLPAHYPQPLPPQPGAQWIPPLPPVGAPYPAMLPPPHYHAYPMSQPTNGLAIASLVCSLLSIPLIVFCVIPTLLSAVAGIGLGLAAIVQINNRPQPGKGLAIAGVAVGAAAILLGVVGVLWFISNFGDPVPNQY